MSAVGPRQQKTSFYLGDVCPNFEANTTKGPIELYKYLGDNWGVLFCYPDDFSPVATTELVMFSRLHSTFEKYNVKLLALSTQNTLSADGTYRDHTEWIRDIEAISGTSLEFPIVHDDGGILANLFHVLDKEDIKNDDEDDRIRHSLAFQSRTIFIIGPRKHFRLILTFPAAVGVNSIEIQRVIHALQTAEKAHVCTPADWLAGEDVIIPRTISDEDATKKFPGFKSMKPYLRFAALPLEQTSVDITSDILQSVPPQA